MKNTGKLMDEKRVCRKVVQNNVGYLWKLPKSKVWKVNMQTLGL
jgi:hypothetical protein